MTPCKTYFIDLSARVKCGWCDELKPIAIHEQIEIAEEHENEAGEIIEQAVNNALADDGWAGGICAECLFLDGKRIADEIAADDDNGY